MHNNRNWRVVMLISICFFIYFFSSILSFAFNIKWEPFDKINLVTEIFHKNQTHNLSQTNIQKQNSAQNNLVQDFELYKKPELITKLTIDFIDGK